jgi:hypothetical protein
MEKKETKAKKPQVKKVKKPVKVEISEELNAIADKLAKIVKEQRGKELGSSACSRLNKIAQDCKFSARNIIR